MARWMSRWLLGKDVVITEQEHPILKDDDLRCTRTGQVLEDLKGRSCFDMNRALAERLEASRAAKPLTRDVLLAEVRKKLSLPATVEPAKVAEADTADTVERTGYTLKKRLFTTEPGIRVPAWDMTPAKGVRGPLVVLVAGEGKASVLEMAEKRVRAGERVLALDLRGLGETAPGKASKGSAFGADTFEAWVGIHLNRPLLGQRTFDLLAVLSALAKETPEGFHLVGVGTGGPIVLHAAALDPQVKSVEVENSILSWTDVAKTPVTVDQLTNVVPGVLRAYDLPDLATLIAPRPLTLRDPIAPTGKPLPATALATAWQPARLAYEKAGAKDRFQIVGRE
jgi:pimeloyl-ACP methyl ester carboxylesterase